MKDELKQPVVVENRPGAGGRLVAEAVKNAPADGSVLMLTPIVVPVLAPMVFAKLPYDPIVDFAPVAQVGNFQFALSVNASHPAKNIERAYRLVQGQPDQGQLRQPGARQPAALLRRHDRQELGLELTHVPYNGGGPMMNALMGDQLTAGIDTLAEQVELHRTGRIRILASTGMTRSPLLPEVPTFAESGLKGVEGHGLVRRLRAGEDARRDLAPAQRGDQQGARQPRAARALHQARPRADRRNAGRSRGAHGTGHGALGADRQGLGLSRRLKGGAAPSRRDHVPSGSSPANRRGGYISVMQPTGDA